MERPRQPLHRRPSTILYAVVLGLALGFGVDVWRSGGPGLWLAHRAGPPAYELLGSRVEIGERSLYLDCRGRGDPTVIFEAGMGGDSSGWGAVFPEVAGLTRACVYDRANRGRSDLRGRHTLADAGDDLAALLAAAGERSPYLLVGHSLGGAYVRAFAAARREQVAGIVLVDAFNPDRFDRQLAAAPPDLAATWAADMAATFDLIERTEGLDWAMSAGELAMASVNGLALEILVVGRRDPRLTGQEADAVDAAWLEGLGSLSSEARVTIVEGSGHFIHLDRPDEVVAAIRRLVERARADRPAPVAQGRTDRPNRALHPGTGRAEAPRKDHR
jgi:pimeloyl-ACP methyl ester carboxylesterase